MKFYVAPVMFSWTVMLETVLCRQIVSENTFQLCWQA